MRVSLNLIKKYVDIPSGISDKQIAYDLTLRTVEVESVINESDKFHDIIVGKILSVKPHPNADKLKLCMTDLGGGVVEQIVCGGSNLYEGELVVVCKPGAEVIWHGVGEPVKIEKTKMRGESSFGMICAASEVFLSDFFPASDESEIIDLKCLDCKPGDNIADVVCMNDTVLEIDNKSLSNRPDLWGHLGIARELSAIYDVELKTIPEAKIDNNLPKYKVSIEDSSKCNRYVAVEIDGIENKKSPMWMQSFLVKCGARPINAIVDITNYVMFALGTPLHAFDKTHVKGEEIIVRNAHEGEELLLLDDNAISLTTSDLVVADSTSPLALAGIKGGKNDSILEDTTSVLLEVANFSAGTIRKSSKRFAEKTDAAIRFEKGIDTNRVDDALSLALSLIKEIFPNSKVVSFSDVYPVATKRCEITVSEEFLTRRLGKKIEESEVKRILTRLGYSVSYEAGEYRVLAPTFRSTGDVSIKDDVMGDIARILSFDSFEAKPITEIVTHSINQRDFNLKRRIAEYLANRCGFYEIFTYPWISEKYIKAAGIDVSDAVLLATPPSPEVKTLRTSLIPGLIEAIQKNLRYFEEFRIFETAQVFKKGEYHPSCDEEVLPIHKNMLAGAIVGKDAKEIFFNLKGVLEAMARLTHMEELKFETKEKPSWADKYAYLSIILNGEVIGEVGLLSIKTMNEVKIKRTNVALFELDMDKLIPFASRDNKYEKLPELPLVEKDLSIVVSEDIPWAMIHQTIKAKVKEVIFIEEYKGDKIPEGMKSITFKVKIESDKEMITSEEINEVINKILTSLYKRCGAKLREV